MNIQTIETEFAGVKLLGRIQDGQEFVAMRPVVEGMGLTWKKQLGKLQSHPILSRQLYTLRGMTGADGKRYSMVCIPLSRLSFWLATVNPIKVKLQIRDKVILFQEKAADVLHEAFTTGRQDVDLLNVEYLPTYHTLHDRAKALAQGSKNERFVHMNLNKAINAAVGLEPGMRGSLDYPLRSLVVTAQVVATRALQGANDHHEGYKNAKMALTQLQVVIAGPTAKKKARARRLTKEAA